MIAVLPLLVSWSTKSETVRTSRCFCTMDVIALRRIWTASVRPKEDANVSNVSPKLVSCFKMSTNFLHSNNSWRKYWTRCKLFSRTAPINPFDLWRHVAIDAEEDWSSFTSQSLTFCWQEDMFWQQDIGLFKQTSSCLALSSWELQEQPHWYWQGYLIIGVCVVQRWKWEDRERREEVRFVISLEIEGPLLRNNHAADDNVGVAMTF